MKNNCIPSWRQKLKSLQNREGKRTSTRWVQLATINGENKPRVRTIVFRDWINTSSMLFFTDSRSKKVKDITTNNNVEILWFFLKSKSQFRFQGTARIMKGKINQWNILSENSKASWFWPSPGKPFEEIINNNNLDINNKPDNFLQIQVDINYVELLKLNANIHKRYYWAKYQNWECLEINP